MYSFKVMPQIVPRFGKHCQEECPHIGALYSETAVQDCPAMGNNLRKLRESKGWTQTEAAEAMGYSKGGYLKLERSERKLNVNIIEKAADVFGVSQSEIFTEEIPIVGHVGAGSQATYYADGDHPNEYVSSPPNATRNTVAVEVRGTSLGSIFDRWLVYYDDVRNPPTPDLLGKLCVVGLDDDRVLVKRLRKGSAQGLFHLESVTDSLIEDVPIVWAAKVKHMTPK